LLSQLSEARRVRRSPALLWKVKEPIVSGGKVKIPLALGLSSPLAYAFPNRKARRAEEVIAHSKVSLSPLRSLTLSTAGVEIYMGYTFHRIGAKARSLVKFRSLRSCLFPPVA